MVREDKKERSKDKVKRNGGLAYNSLSFPHSRGPDLIWKARNKSCKTVEQRIQSTNWKLVTIFLKHQVSMPRDKDLRYSDYDRITTKRS